MERKVKITKYCYKNELNDEMDYMINFLAGSIDLVDKEESKIIDKWMTYSEVDIDKIKNIKEKNLYNQMCIRKYLLDESEEIELERKVEKQAYERYIEMCNSEKVVVIIPSYNCNFKCPYCFEAGRNSSNDIMTKEMVDKIFEENKNNISNISFYGGEPFLPEHKEIIQYVISKAPNATYSAITNGYNLMEFYEILKDVTIENIQVTIDGPGDIHNKTRVSIDGKETFDVIMDAVDYYINHGINMKIRMNINKNNIDECLKLRRELYEKFNGRNICFELQPIFQNSMYNTRLLNNKINKFDIEDAFAYGADRGKYNMVAYTNKSLINYLQMIDGTWSPLYTNCNAETINRFYDAKGDVYSCTLAVGDNEARVGTYYPESRSFENNMLKRNIGTITKCKDCIYRFVCGGGCAYDALKRCGKIDSCNCERFKEILEKTIPEAILTRIRNNEKEG